MVEKSYNKTVIDFNFGKHKDISTLKSDILRRRLRVDKFLCGILGFLAHLSRRLMVSL